ncbi:MAG: DUF4328 domain-containing protein [Verrucomicrobiota bacterium JB022]|nr:DUF4328 domain-containing protein [Verrucomicrobiota bacterium JB022]
MIYLAYHQSRHGPLALDEVRRRYDTGELPPDTLYWQEGMEAWSPVHELLGAPPPLAPVPVAAPPPPYLEIQKLSRWVPVATYFTMGALPLCLLLGLIGSMALSVKAGGPPSEAIGFLAVASLVGGGMLVGLGALATQVLYLTWLYRAQSNLRALGAQGLEFSPLLTLVCNFVPMVSMVVPFLALRELSKASQDPLDWRQRQPSRAVIVWWVCAFLPIVVMFFNYLLVGITAFSLQGMQDGTLPPAVLGLVFVLFLPLPVIMLVPLFCMNYLVKIITRQQEALRVRHG